eukprot:365596-Chlamydomonas_euryale.AAC.26
MTNSSEQVASRYHGMWLKALHENARTGTKDNEILYESGADSLDHIDNGVYRSTHTILQKIVGAHSVCREDLAGTLAGTLMQASCAFMC